MLLAGIQRDSAKERLDGSGKHAGMTEPHGIKWKDMELQFVTYIAQQKKLYFNIIADPEESNELSSFQTELFSRIVLQSKAQLVVYDKELIITELKNASHINFILANIKHCCERYVKNWDEFSSLAKKNCNIQQEEKSKNFPLKLNTLPSDILHLIASKFIGTSSIPAMANIDKKIYVATNNPEMRLQTYYPDFFREMKNKNRLINSTLFNDTYTNEVKKFRHFWRLNNNEYPLISSNKVIKLSILFKNGDLPGIKNSNLTFDDIVQTRYPFLYWANRNGHKKILDYFYEKPSNNEVAMHPLLKAIYCFQGKEELLITASETKDINMVVNSRTPLMTAAICNNLIAVEFLCQRKETILDFEVDAFKGYYNNALQCALAEDSLEVVKYLLDKGAKFNALDFCANHRHSYSFEAWVGKRCKEYLLEHPVLALELQKQNGYMMTNGWAYLYCAKQFYQKEINAWLEKNIKNLNTILRPIINHLISHEYNKNDLIKRFHHHSFFTLIIKLYENSSLEDCLQFIETIRSYKNQEYSVKNDILIQNVLNQLESNFMHQQLQATSFRPSVIL